MRTAISPELEDRRRLFNPGNRLWHTDLSFKRIAAKHSMLHARTLCRRSPVKPKFAICAPPTMIFQRI